MRNQNDKLHGFLPFMDKPEISAILLSLKLLQKPVQALEWGSGNSTVYLNSYLPEGSSWHSVEHNFEWSLKVKEIIQEVGINNIFLNQVDPNSEYKEGTDDDGNYDTFKDYILYPTTLNKKFDLILVDGRSGLECMQIGWMLLTNTGLMILHDAERDAYSPGIPQNCFYICLTNHEAGKSLLFMSKSDDLINKMTCTFKRELPHNVEIKSYPDIEVFMPDKKQTINPSCLFLNTYYPAFLEQHYRDNPGLSSLPYRIQKDLLQAEFFGDSDFYSEGLKKAGWNAEDLIINCSPLQQAWAKENGCSGSDLDIAVEQIRRMKPQVVYLQDISVGTRDFLSAIRPYTNLIAGQIASPVPAQADLHGFDIIFSSFPHFTERFRRIGLTAYYQPLAFDPRVLEKLPRSAREYQVTFAGGISMAHSERKDFLEMISGQVPIDFWGYGVDLMPDHCSLKNRYHGEAWGLQMFSVLHRSFITINNHINVAENNANNMRLFEATGCGALLITDYRDNLNELFEIGKEIVAYRSPDECAALIKYYMAHPDEAEKIAHAGQARTLRDHTYTKRMEQTAEILERHLRYRQEKDLYPVPDMSRISYGHEHIEKNDVTDELTSAWKSEEIPIKQRALVQQELENMYRGHTPTVYKVLSDCLRPYVYPGCSILEVGCASGYYYEVLEYLLNMKTDYTGVDYSEPLISMAKDYYPHAKFFVSDGAGLSFADKQFFIVISSCILLHTPNYQDHIKETARVAQRFAVAHRTPVCRRRPTQYFKKCAYGVETVELVFNEEELVREFSARGFQLADTLEYYTNQNEDRYETTYLFRRVPDSG
jgi:SAM-dependent methyltransferase